MWGGGGGCLWSSSVHTGHWSHWRMCVVHTAHINADLNWMQSKACWSYMNEPKVGAKILKIFWRLTSDYSASTWSFTQRHGEGKGKETRQLQPRFEGPTDSGTCDPFHWRRWRPLTPGSEFCVLPLCSLGSVSVLVLFEISALISCLPSPIPPSAPPIAHPLAPQLVILCSCYCSVEFPPPRLWGQTASAQNIYALGVSELNTDSY